MVDYDLLSREEIFQLEPEVLLEAMRKRCCLVIPVTIETVEEMQQAGRILSACASEYSYLSDMALNAKIIKRRFKQEGRSKKEIDDALSREDIFEHFAEVMKAGYNAVSRMITIKQQVNEELKMTDGR